MPVTAELLADSVSSRAPVRGHPPPAMRIFWHDGFKSCPREGASSPKFSYGGSLFVSSRAPVRGHQAYEEDYVAAIKVSSRAPVRGHLLPPSGFRGFRSFKSCPREGASFVFPFRGTPRSWFQVVPP